MKASAQVVVHSARRHLAQGEQVHLQGPAARFTLRSARVKSCQEIKNDGTRKLRRGSEPSFFRIESTGQLIVGRRQRGRVNLPLARRRRTLRLA